MNTGNFDGGERVPIPQSLHEPTVMITALLELFLRVGHEVLRQTAIAGQVSLNLGQTADLCNESVETSVRNMVLMPVLGIGRQLDESIELITLLGGGTHRRLSHDGRFHQTALVDESVDRVGVCSVGGDSGVVEVWRIVGDEGSATAAPPAHEDSVIDETLEAASSGDDADLQARRQELGLRQSAARREQSVLDGEQNSGSDGIDGRQPSELRGSRGGEQRSIDRISLAGVRTGRVHARRIGCRRISRCHVLSLTSHRLIVIKLINSNGSETKHRFRRRGDRSGHH